MFEIETQIKKIDIKKKICLLSRALYRIGITQQYVGFILRNNFAIFTANATLQNEIKKKKINCMMFIDSLSHS